MPTSAQVATWDSTVTAANTTVLGANLTFAGIAITRPGGLVTINAGNTLTLGAAAVDIDMVNASQNLTLNCGLNLGAANVWDVAASRTLTVGGAVTGSFGITKQGAGTNILSGANSYTGTTTISAGTLILNNASALGTTPGVDGTSSISLAGATTLSSTVAGGATITAPITLSGTGNINLLNGNAAVSTNNLNGAIGGTTSNLVFSTDTATHGNQISYFVLGAASTYTGNTLITTGDGANNPVYIKNGVVNALPVTTVLSFAQIAGGGSGRNFTYDLNGFDQTLSGLDNGGVLPQVRRMLVYSPTPATLTINNTANYTFGGSTVSTSVGTIGSTTRAQITGAIALTKNGTGTFTLGGTLAGGATAGGNTHTGATKVLGGILVLGETNSLQNSPFDTANTITGTATDGLRTTVTTLTLGGLTGNKNFADVFTTTSGGYGTVTGLTLNPASGTSYSYSGGIGNGAAGMTLTKSGSGTQVLSGNSTYSGSTTISAGRLQGVTGGSLASATVILNATTATNSVSITDNTKGWTNAAFTASAAGVLEFDFGAITPGAVAPLQVTGAATFTATPTVRVVVSSALAEGTYPLMKWGSGGAGAPTVVTVSTLTPGTAANLNVSGNTLNLVIAPNVKADNSSNLNDPASWTAGVVPGTVEFATWDSTVTGDNTTILGGDLTWGGIQIKNPAGLVTINAGNTLTIGSLATDIDMSTATTNLVLNCNLTLGAANVWDVTNSQTLTVAGTVTGANAITKQGEGTVVLSGSGNAYTGATTISGGTLKLGANNVIPDGTGNGNVTNNGVLDLNTFSETVNNLTGAGVVDTVAGGTPILTVSNGASSTFSGVITNSSGTLTLVKTGSGTLTLSGNNGYSGGTTNNAGIIAANTATALGTGPMTFNGGTRLVVATGLNFTNAISIASAGGAQGRGLVEPGTAAGTATISGPITINGSPTGGGIFAAPTAGTILNVSGVITATVPVTQRAGTVMFSGGGTGYQNLNIGADTVMVGAANGIATSATVTIGGSAAAVLDLNGFNQSLVGITKGGSSATITNSSTTTDSTLTITGSSTYAGAIVDGTTRKVALTVNGGDLTLSRVSTYSGDTTINAGKLQGVVGGSAENSTVILNSTTATNGVSVTVNTKGWTNAALTVAAAGVLEFDFGAVTPSTTISPLNITGLADFTATPTVSVVSSAALGQGTYPLMTWGSVSGTIPTNANLTVTPTPQGTPSLINDGVTLSLVIDPAILVKADNQDDLTNTTSWVGGVVPTAFDIAQWDSTVTGDNTTALGADTNWAGIKIVNPAGLVTITNDGYTLTLGAAAKDIDMSTATTNLVLNCNVALDGANVWDVTAGQTLTVGGVVSGANTLTKEGTGTVILTNANTYTNITTVNAGTLIIDDGSIGSSASTSNNAALVYNLNANARTYANAISGTGTLTKSGTNTLTLSGTNSYTGGTTITGGTLQIGAAGTSGSIATTAGVTNNGALVYNRSDSLTVGYPITGTGTLTQAGAGAVTLTNNNTYTGGTTISAGTLQIGAGGTSGSIASTAGVTNNSALVYNRSDTLNAGYAINGSGNVTNLGTGTVSLSGGGNLTGNLIVAAGTVQVGANNGISTNAGLEIFGGTLASRVLDLNGYDQIFSKLVFNAANIAGNLTITGGPNSTLTINSAGITEIGPGGTINAARDVTVGMSGLGEFIWTNSANTFRVGARVGSSISAASTVTVTFAATNTITAAQLAVADQGFNQSPGTGILHLGQSNVLNANAINVGYSFRTTATLDFNTGLDSPTVRIRGADGTANVNTFDVGSVNHTANVTYTATVDFSAGQLDARVSDMRIGAVSATTGSGTRQGTENAFFTMGKGTLNVTNLSIGLLNGSVAGGTATTLQGNGTLTLMDAAGVLTADNIYLGVINNTLTSGSPSSKANFNLGAGTVQAKVIDWGTTAPTGLGTATRNFNFTNGIVRNYPGSDLTISNVPINLTGSGARNFEATAGQSITVAPAITGTGQGFTKIGAGSLILTGTNTYSGGTTIGAGTLALSGGGSIAAVNMTIATNATFDISGISGASYALPSSGTLTMNLNKTGSTLSQGQLNLATKSLTYGGTLTVVSNANSEAFASGNSFTLFVTNGTANQLGGWFSSLTLPSLASGIAWDTNNLATSGVLDIYNFSSTTLAFPTLMNTSAVISALKMGYQASSARGTPVAVSASNPAHGTAGISAGALTYTPASNYTGSDTFTVTYADGHGTQTMTVNVTVNPANTGPQITPQDVGGYGSFTASGMMNQGYIVQLSTNLPTFTDYTNVTSAANGVISFTDSVSISDHGGSVYYRLKQQ